MIFFFWSKKKKDGRPGRAYLVLVNGLVGDGPAAGTDINGEEIGPGHSVIGHKIGPAHEDADIEHETLACEGKWSVGGSQGQRTKGMGAKLIQR